MFIIVKIRGGIRAAIFFACLAAVLTFAVRSAVAHSPQAVDAQGNACIQVDCAGDKITNRCNFPVQLTSQCKGGGSLCIITGAFNSETAGEVKVLGTRDFGTEWERALLRVTDFYPKDISRTNTSGSGREQFFGYACAVHTDGSVESAGGEWHKDDEGNSVFVCVHNHTDGQGRHTVRPLRPEFECPGERINNWAAECVEYKSYQSLTRGADGTENFAPSGHADGTYLVNNCKCPVILDSCHGKHPCHQDANRQAVLQPGEDSFVAALPGSEASWAACYRGDRINQNEIKSVGENLWTCGKYKTECSEVIAFSDDSDSRLQFEGISRVEAVAREEIAEAETRETDGQPDDSCPYANDGECDDPGPCPAGTDTTDCASRRGEESGESAQNDQPDDSCKYANDGVCDDDDPGLCAPGTDATDCSSRRGEEVAEARETDNQPDDSCPYANDGECDDPGPCPPGTDTTDCAVGRGEEAASTEETGGQSENVEEYPFVSLRGTPPPTGTKTEQFLQDTDRQRVENGSDYKTWGGQLDVNAKVTPVYWNGDHSHLYIAIGQNDMEAAKWLLANGSDIDEKTHWGGSLLFAAAKGNAVEIAKLLIDNGADVKEKTDNGYTPLHAAEGAEVAKLLIAKGAEVNAKSDNGYTPLHEAAENNAAEVAKLLIDNGAEVNAENDNGYTPLDKAFGNGHGAMQSLLRQHDGRCNRYGC